MTPAEKRLSTAIRDVADNCDHDDQTELLRVLARLIEGKTIYEAMGAPGDWGYGTPIGDAFEALIDEPEPAAPPVFEWHYIADKLPADDTAVLVATTTSGQPGEAVFRDGVFLWVGSDIAIEGVYAWTDLPEIPDQRPAAPAPGVATAVSAVPPAKGGA